MSTVRIINCPPGVAHRLVDAEWGACIWSREPDGVTRCYPTGEAIVEVLPDAPAPDPRDAEIERLRARLAAAGRAVEHAGFLATAAEHLLAAIDKHAFAVVAFDNARCDTVVQAEIDMDAAGDAQTEARQRVRSCIYEFRKRADRAMQPAAPTCFGIYMDDAVVWRDCLTCAVRARCIDATDAKRASQEGETQEGETR